MIYSTSYYLRHSISRSTLLYGQELEKIEISWCFTVFPRIFLFWFELQVVVFHIRIIPFQNWVILCLSCRSLHRFSVKSSICENHSTFSDFQSPIFLASGSVPWVPNLSKMDWRVFATFHHLWCLGRDLLNFWLVHLFLGPFLMCVRWIGFCRFSWLYLSNLLCVWICLQNWSNSLVHLRLRLSNWESRSCWNPKVSYMARYSRLRDAYSSSGWHRKADWRFGGFDWWFHMI